jgi:hypothetical protein
LLLPVAGDVFSLDSPLYRTALWRLTLEPKRQKNRKAITRNESSKGRSSTQRFKLLAVSDALL